MSKKGKTVTLFAKRKYTSSNRNLALAPLLKDPMTFSRNYVQLDTKHICKITLTHLQDKKINGQHFPLNFHFHPTIQNPTLQESTTITNSAYKQ